MALLSSFRSEPYNLENGPTWIDRARPHSVGHCDDSLNLWNVGR